METTTQETRSWSVRVVDLGIRPALEDARIELTIAGDARRYDLWQLGAASQEHGGEHEVIHREALEAVRAGRSARAAAATHEAYRRFRGCSGHQPQENLERGPYGYSGGVAVHPYTEQEPRAAGGIMVVEVCRCGGERKVNCNQGYREYGTWHAREVQP